MKTGYNAHRLKENDPYHAKEVTFVKEFNKEISYNNDYMNQIVYKNRRSNNLLQIEYDYLTEEEEKIVLSVIQWLGTHVGQSFLERVNSKL